MKIFATIIPTSLVTNSSLYPLFAVSWKPKLTIEFFRKLMVESQKMFLCLIIVSYSSTSKTWRIQQAFFKDLSYILFLFVS